MALMYHNAQIHLTYAKLIEYRRVYYLEIYAWKTHLLIKQLVYNKENHLDGCSYVSYW